METAKSKRVKRYPYTVAFAAIFCWVAHGSYYTNADFFVAAPYRDPASLIGQLSSTQVFGWVGDLLYNPWTFGLLVTAAICGTAYMVNSLLMIRNYFHLFLIAGLIASSRITLAAHVYWPHETIFAPLFALCSLWFWKRQWTGIRVTRYLLGALFVALSLLCGAAGAVAAPFMTIIILLMALSSGDSPLLVLAKGIEYAAIFGGGVVAERLLLSLLGEICNVNLTVALALPDGELLSAGISSTISLLLYFLLMIAALLVQSILARKPVRFSNDPQMIAVLTLLVLLIAIGALFWSKGEMAFLMGVLQPTAIISVALLDHTMTGPDRDKAENLSLEEWMDTFLTRIRYRYPTGPLQENGKEGVDSYEPLLGLWNWKKILLYRTTAFIVFWGGAALMLYGISQQSASLLWIFVLATICVLLMNRMDIRSYGEIRELNEFSPQEYRIRPSFCERMLGTLLHLLLVTVLVFDLVNANLIFLSLSAV